MNLKPNKINATNNMNPMSFPNLYSENFLPKTQTSSNTLEYGRGFNYYSLDDMAKAEGVEAVFEFLYRNPTIITNENGISVYRHTNIPQSKYRISKWNH